MAHVELAPAQLKRSASVGSATAEVAEGRAANELGQPRALEALNFGMSVAGVGYNVYALGETQTGMHQTVAERLQGIAALEPIPNDLCYITNFTDPSQPLTLSLPSGVGRRIRDDVKQLLLDLTTMIPAAFSSDDFRLQLNKLHAELEQKQMGDTKALQNEAKTHGLIMMPTPNGFMFAPEVDGSVLKAEEFEKLDDAKKHTIEESIDLMTEKVRSRLQEYPAVQEDVIRQQRALAETTARQVLAQLTGKLRARYNRHEGFLSHLNAIASHLLDNIDKLLLLNSAKQLPFGVGADDILRDYEINLVVDHDQLSNAPVVYESNPSLENLVGKLDHRFEQGIPVSDFTMIRPGALHRANGGYLILDAERLLNKPFAWEALKRALLDGCIRIESVSQLMSMAYSITLEPQSVPLQVKIVLLGSRRLYHLLRQYDTDFDSLFKVLADFSDEVQWNLDNELAYSQLLHGFEKEQGLRPIEDAAVCRMIEYASRLVSDQQHLSAHTQRLYDLARESDHFAAEAQVDRIGVDQVNRAIAKRDYRVDRIRDLVLQNIERGVTVIATQGATIGQINGLSVASIGKLVFGQPSRITATARLGSGEFIDIERESKLGGKIHSKAVMIVASFIGYRYAKEQPLSLHASLGFEQSYGGVEGDSASVAEVCALLSAIIEKPIRQELAVTGSMDQHGAVQAIGGVNEKIEGFYSVCESQGLTGKQGVIIPQSNRENLMLSQTVIDAVEQGDFHIYTVNHIDEAMALLFGQPDKLADIEVIDNQVKERLSRFHDLWKQSRGGMS